MNEVNLQNYDDDDVAKLNDWSCRSADLMEATAHMLRGMTLDPAIPVHAKTAMWHRAKELELLVEEFVQ